MGESPKEVEVGVANKVELEESEAREVVDTGLLVEVGMDLEEG